MIKVENIDVWGFQHAVRGMRNPLNSWNKNDSDFIVTGIHGTPEVQARIGENDLNLMKRLYKAGTEHRKYLRQIIVSMDITAPLYWWKEFDTYKVGTVANSCSTMHKIAAKEFELDDFSHEHLISDEDEMFNDEWFGFTGEVILLSVISNLNFWRNKYLLHKDKKYWWQLIQLLPSSYNQRRTITMNYENAVTMIKQRTGHKLDEWDEFVEILKDLPYIKQIME
jgi:hypothetical protein